MRQNNTPTSIYVAVPESLPAKQYEENYCYQLEQLCAKYHKADYYWQVGETSKVQGWILHISVIAPQITSLLNCILPILLERKVCFKLAKNRIIARNILDGNLGYEQLGKVISIYPENDQDALELAEKLIQSTTSYRGPAIPTDIHLGGIVYTRYGSINPIFRPGNNGQMEEYIYTIEGKLVKDNYPIPFELPAGISWPYGHLCKPDNPNTKRNIRNIYRPLTFLKLDPRGNVIKCLYVKGFLRVGTCVIKAGKKNMLADDMGRDIQDRLCWQKDLHNELANIVRLPKIIDFFEEDDELFLVMEFIKGKSLHDSLIEIHGNQRSWFQLSNEAKLLLLSWLSKILSILDLLHKNGFVHRDIQPGNFIINPHGEIVLIDTELAYDLKKENHELPFELGTPGFMSPEQESVSIPTIKEDIFGLGGLMINIFTCINAPRFDTKDLLTLSKNLTYFIHDKDIADLICSCLSHDPSLRPNIHEIQACLADYKRKLTTVQQITKQTITIEKWEAEPLKIMIREAITGLNQKPMPLSKGIWLSKTMKKESGYDFMQKEFSPYPGLHTGMTGVLYLLARAKQIGYDLATNKIEYKESWKFIYSEYMKSPENIFPGLYNGAAGIALTLVEGMKAGLLEESALIRQYMLKCLDISNEYLNFSQGVAGQGVVLLQCNSYLPEDTKKRCLNNCIRQLLTKQGKDGSWQSLGIQKGKQNCMPISWSHGLTGIIYFLLAYIRRYQNSEVQQALNRSLLYLGKETHDLKGLFIPSIYQKILNKRPEIGDERTSSILCFIQAYDILKDPYFKETAEAALRQYPNFVVNNNFSQDGGLANLGEVYLEASNIFQNEEWEQRAHQIASVFQHTRYKSNSDNCYWLTDETRKPTPDLLVGNSGIIHFLLRCDNPNKLGHILLR